MRLNSTALLFVVCLMFATTQPAIGQATNEQEKTPAAPQDAEPNEAPHMDINGFFKKAEKQTRKAQEGGNPNCVPKPAPEDPIS